MMEYSPLIMVLRRQEIKSQTNYNSAVFSLTSDLLNSCGSPVVEVHDGLNGVPSSRGDIPLKSREQRRDHVHAVLLTLPESKHTSVAWRRETAGDRSGQMKQKKKKRGSTCKLEGSFQ